MKTKELRNGSLYINKTQQRIERVRSKANSSSVFTTVHGDELSLVPAKELSLASTQQCNDYLGL